MEAATCLVSWSPREWTLPSIFFLYVHSSRRQRSIRSAMNPAMEINQPIFKSGFILLPGDPAHSGCGFPLQRVKAFPQQIDGQVVEQSGELHLLIFPCCFPHACQSLEHALPALSRVRVRLTCVLLDRRVGIELQRAGFRWRVTVLALSIARRGSQFHHGHVSGGPPIILDGRISRVQLETLAFPLRIFPGVAWLKRWSAIHPAFVGLPAASSHRERTA